MTRRPFWARALVAGGVVAAAIALASCQTEGITPSTKAMRPLSDAMIADIERKNMEKTSPILVRLFKQEAELEVWKEDRSGHYALLKTYPICRWSGELGPKIKEGDRQAPEGFYSITPAQMNPNSAYYLSFNLGYPNAFDRALGRTGSQLMVHGDCSSRGCYAMTDEQIAEIYALGRESFFGGQRAFQVQAYPFRMTAANMAKHRNNPNMPFWRMIKQGYDAFEVTKLEPKVDVCEKRYVFNASAPQASVMGNASPALSFSPAGKCPAFEVPAEIAEAVNEKQRKDDIEIAELTRRNTPVAPVRANTDGGMNPVFLAALNSAKNQEIRDSEGNIRAIVAPVRAAPGTIPAHVNPPREAAPQYAEGSAPVAVAMAAETPAQRSAPQRTASTREGPTLTEKIGSLFSSSNSKPVRVASAEPVATSEEASAKKGGFFSRLFKPKAGDKADEQKSAQPASSSRDSAKPRVIGLRGSETANAKPAAAPVPPAPVQQAAARPQVKPQPLDAEPRPASVAASGLMAGAQPAMPASSFSARWGGM
ncbi:MAG: L,D-transpeptidase family protein [Pseudorhodoplanes sp.]